MSIDIIPVWKKVTPELRDELVAFWMENKAIADPQKAAARAAQAAVIGRDAEGKLSAVATCDVRVLPRLRQPMYFYRHFFAPSMRGQRLTKTFAARVKELLHEHQATLANAESLGILIELESKLLDEAYTHAYEADSDHTFIGYSPRGFKLFVSYFKDARLGPPVQIQRTAVAAGRRGA